jgi:hypothetical protein
MAEQVHHHFADTVLGRPNAAMIGSQSQLATNRGLHTIAIENLAFDFGRCDRFVAHRLNGDPVAVFRVQMLHGAEELAAV